MRSGRVALWTTTSFLCAWGLDFIWTTSFVHEGRRVFCLFDDAMISMTYARNLVEGHGLNWARQGEPVEGFTHPLWVLLMVFVHLLPLKAIHLSLAVQLPSLAFLVANLIVLRRLMIRHFSGSGDDPRWLLPVVLTAGYYPLNHWALQGLETGLQALLFTTALCLCLDVVDGRGSPVALLGTLTLAMLLRLDMVLIVLPVMLTLLLNRHRVRDSARWRLGWLLFFASPLAYAAFRWLYFHELLPNTYYLKMTGVPAAVRIQRGYLVLLDSIRPYQLMLGTILAAAAALAPTRPKLLLPLATVLLTFAYSVYVGGDAWEWSSVGANRFVAWAMPGVFLLAGALLAALRLGRNPKVRWSALALSCVTGVLTFNGLWPSAPADERWRNVLLRQAPLHVEDNVGVFGEIHTLRHQLDPRVLGGHPNPAIDGHLKTGH